MGVLEFCFIIASGVALLPTLEATDDCYKVKRIVVPVFTPVYKYNYSINTNLIGAYAQYLNDVGADAVLVKSTVGEGPTMNLSDSMMVVDAWMEAAKPQGLLVCVSIGGGSLPDAQALAAYAEKQGASAIFVMPEVYYRPKTAEELVYYIELIYRAASKIHIVYDDIPEYTDVKVNIRRFFQLATERIPTFRGVKSTSFRNLLLLRPEITDQQQLYLANYFYLAPALCVGIKNLILPEFNFYPKLITDIVKYRENGKNMTRSTNLYQRLLDLVEIITARGDEIAALKAYFEYITGIKVNDPRPPIIPLTTEQKEAQRRNTQDYIRQAKCEQND